MAMIQLPIDDASDDQLYEFAENMGLTPASRARTAVLATLSEAWTNPFILIAEEAVANEQQYEAPALTVHARMEGGVGADDPKVVINISKTTMPGGRDPVPVSVNGRCFVIQRDMNVEIPYRYYEALQNARRAEIHQDEKTFERFESDHTNYPMNTLSAPSAAEIAEWRKKIVNEVMPA